MFPSHRYRRNWLAPAGASRSNKTEWIALPKDIFPLKESSKFKVLLTQLDQPEFALIVSSRSSVFNMTSTIGIPIKLLNEAQVSPHFQESQIVSTNDTADVD